MSDLFKNITQTAVINIMISIVLKFILNQATIRNNKKFIKV